MRGILEQLFQANVVFPPGPEREQHFSALGDEVQALERQLDVWLAGDALKQVKHYLELREDFCNSERLLAYENGFLLATALWWQVTDRLGDAQP